MMDMHLSYSRKRKGFTIVELVIVIAVIAILAGVLIPTFSGIIKTANESNDVQAARNMNTALVADEGGVEDNRPKTLCEVQEILDRAGYEKDNLTAIASDDVFYWCPADNTVVISRSGYVTFPPETVHEGKQVDDSTEGYIRLDMSLDDKRAHGNQDSCSHCGTALHVHSFDKEIYASDKTNHWIKCDSDTCSQVKDGSTIAHDYTGAAFTYVDDATHKQACTVCSYEKSAIHASATPADCKNKAVCDSCGQEYGSLDADAHIAGTWTDNGEDHIKKCTLCDVTLETAGHNYANTGTFDAHQTCSDCQNVISAHALAFVSDSATCTSDGVKVYRCSCGYETQEESPMTGHSYGTYTKMSETEHKAVCENGCGAEDIQAHVSTGENAATCSKAATCDVCKSEYGSTVEHTYTKNVDNGDGTHKVVCNGCGAVEAGKEAVTHTYGEYSVSEGSHVRACTDCASVDSHAPVAGTAIRENVVDATCTVGGTYDSVVYCTTCNIEISRTAETTDATGIHTGGTATCTAQAVCTTCSQLYGELDASNHTNVISDAAVSATCISTGLTEGSHCGACNVTIVEQTTVDKNMSNHTKATFTYSAGNGASHVKKYECCGQIANEAETCSGGTATCTAQAVCSSCKTAYGTNLGHTGGSAYCNALAVCTRCNQSYGAYGSHDGGVNGGTAAVHTKCGRCGTTLSSTHSYSSSTTNPTCTSGGYTKYTCGCGYSYTGNNTGAYGHTGGSATCSSYAQCSRCRQSYGNLGSHSYGSYTKTSLTGHKKKCNYCSTTTGSEENHTYKAEGSSSLHCEICNGTQSPSTSRTVDSAAVAVLAGNSKTINIPVKSRYIVLELQAQYGYSILYDNGDVNQQAYPKETPHDATGGETVFVFIDRGTYMNGSLTLKNTSGSHSAYYVMKIYCFA